MNSSFINENKINIESNGVIMPIVDKHNIAKIKKIIRLSENINNCVLLKLLKVYNKNFLKKYDNLSDDIIKVFNIKDINVFLKKINIDKIEKQKEIYIKDINDIIYDIFKLNTIKTDSQGNASIIEFNKNKKKYTINNEVKINKNSN